MPDEKALVFISFRDVEPDRGHANAIAMALSEHHEVFFSSNLKPGTDWGAAIDGALNRADVFIVVVSTALAEKSRMVQGEIEVAIRRLEHSNRPVIIPVQLQGVQAVRLPYPLNAYLNQYQFLEWSDDVCPVVDAVGRALRTEATTPVERLAVPTGKTAGVASARPHELFVTNPGRCVVVSDGSSFSSELFSIAEESGFQTTQVAGTLLPIHSRELDR